jgi:hypothetical protein
MRDPLLCVRGIPRLEPGTGSALQLVRDLTADAFVNVGAHRFRLRIVAQHCAATLPSRRAAGVQASGGFSGAEKATPSSRSSFTRNGVYLFGWKPLDARRGQRPKPSERRLKPPKCCTTQTGVFALCSGLHRQAHRWNDAWPGHRALALRRLRRRGDAQPRRPALDRLARSPHGRKRHR